MQSAHRPGIHLECVIGLGCLAGCGYGASAGLRRCCARAERIRCVLARCNRRGASRFRAAGHAVLPLAVTHSTREPAHFPASRASSPALAAADYKTIRVSKIITTTATIHETIV